MTALPAARFAGLDIGSAYTKFAVTGFAATKFAVPGPESVPEASVCTPVATALAWDGSRPVVGRDATAPERAFDPLAGFLRLSDQPAAAGWSAAGWRAGGSPQDATRDFLIGLLHGEDEGCGFPHLRETAGLAVTVPTPWTRTATGTAARSWLRNLLEEDLQLPVCGLYGTAVCAAADHLAAGVGVGAGVSAGAGAGAPSVPAAGDPAGGDLVGNRLLLVCDLGVDAVEATLCDLGRDDTGMPVARRLDTERLPGPAGRTFAERAVRRAFRNATASEPTPAQVPALLAAFADGLHDNQSRAAAVLERVREDPRRLDTATVLRFGDGYRLTAADVLAGFAPVAQTVDAAVTELLRRRCDLAAGGCAVEVVVVGGLGFLPPAQDAVRAAARAALRPSVPGASVVVRSVAHPESAAARGAALIAAGQVRVVEYYPHTLSLRVHRVRNGQLVPESVRVVAAGDAPQERVESAGMPIVVHVDGSHGDDVVLDVRLDGSGIPRTARACDAAGIPCGDYHLGVRLDRSHLGALVLHPVAGTGRPHALMLEVAE